MPELLFLGPHVIFGRFHRLRDTGDPFYHPHTRAFQRLDLLWIVRHQPHRADSQVDQDRAGQLITAQVGFETQLLIGLDRIGALILKLIGAQLIEQTDPTAFLIFVNDQAPTLARNGRESQLQLRPAIASKAVKYIASEALRMDAHQRRIAGNYVAQAQHHGLFLSVREPINAKMTEAAGEISLGNLTHW